MKDQASALRGLIQQRPLTADRAVAPVTSYAQTIAITSGKGGVGKSNIALNLAIVLAANGEPVCLLDANPGLGNIDLLCGLNAYWNLGHVGTGARTLSEIMLEGPGGISIIPGANRLSDCLALASQHIFEQLHDIEQSHQYIVIDAGTGLHDVARRLVTEADVLLVVTTPEPTSIADAYATIKACGIADRPRIELLVNQAESPQQARAIVQRVQETALTFLRRDIESAGLIASDHHVVRAVARRTPFVIDSPHAPASCAIRQLARRMKSLAETQDGGEGIFPRIRRQIAVNSA